MNTIIPFSSYTLLFEAIETGDIHQFQKFLDSGMCVDQADEEGLTLLMLAARERQPQMLAELIRRGANIEQQDQDGETALSWACMENNAKAVRMLLEAGASASHTDDKGLTPLHWMMYTDEDGDEFVETVETLLAHGADINACSHEVPNPIAEAVLHGNLLTAELLRQKGGHIDVPETGFLEEYPITPLFRAVLQHGGPMMFNKNGSVAEKGKTIDNLPVINWLLQHGARDFRAADGISIMDMAKEKQLYAVVDVLEARPVSPTVDQTRNRLRIVK